MAPPIKPQAQRKTAYAVSLSMAERAIFQHMGGSPYLQGHLLHIARQLVALPHAGMPKGIRQAAQDIINTHAAAGLARVRPAGKLAAYWHEARKNVLALFPRAVVMHDRMHQGAGISWAVYEAKPTDLDHMALRVTGGWMTQGQAWERAAAALNAKPARKARRA